MKAARTKLRAARPEAEVTQGIIAINHTVGQFLEFSYAEGSEDADGNFIPDPSTVRVQMVAKKAYRSLMSKGPAWAPEKPAGVYRLEDLFALLDYMADNPQALASPADDINRQG